jgi:hypothetical protein
MEIVALLNVINMQENLIFVPPEADTTKKKLI